ncbi:MAG: DUF1800 domain-containing protein [Pseudomonadota bacterium]
MSSTYRNARFLRATVSLVAFAALAACSASSDAPAPPPAAAASTPEPTTTTTTASGSLTANQASRFLNQSTFGPTDEAIADIQSSGAEAWLLNEFNKRHESILEDVLLAEAAGEDIGGDTLSEAFWTRAIQSDDQLRQRVGYALSQLFVASYADGGLEDRPIVMANYMDIMSAGAFGTYRQLLENVTYSPAMAIYLTYLQNQKANDDNTVVPDENYAREIMQLFTIGLLELNQNGELRLDGSGAPIETYDNDDVTELAKVFTGLSWGDRDRFFGRPENIRSEYLPLEMYDDEHATAPKRFLGVTVPGNTPGDASISIALDALHNHPNTPPFIARQLIQRLVTSNPNADYVGRVAAAFRAGSYTLPSGQPVGSGARGDMRAVVAAILFDEDARNDANMTDPTFGKLKEPVLRFTQWARAFGVTDTDTDDNSVDDLNDTRSPNRLNQQAYRSPSVFNFYRPGFVSPGSESAAAGLVAPELQITTASSVTGYVNFMDRFIRGDVDGQDFAPDYTAEIALAGNPASLVDSLNNKLAYGALRAETRQRAIDAVTAITSGNDGFTRDEVRVHTAILFIMASSDYIISR